MKKIQDLHHKNPFLAKGTLIVFATIMSNFLNLLFNAYLGRAIPIEDFALISVIGSIFALSDIPVGALGKTVTYKSAHFLGKYNVPATAFWRYLRSRALLFSLSISALWVFGSVAISKFFQIDSILPILSLTPLWITTILSSVDYGYIGGNQKFGYLAVVSISEAFIKLLLVVALVMLGYEEFAYLAIVFSSLVSFALILTGAQRLKKSMPVAVKNTDEKFPFTYFFSSILTKVSTVCYLSFDVILAKHFLPPAEAGQYALLSLSGKMVYLAGSFFSQFLIPLISHKEGKGANPKKLFNMLLLASFSSSFLAFVFIGFFGKFTMPLIFGANAQPILNLIPWYALSMVAFTVATNIVSFYQIRSNHALPFVSFLLAIVQIVAITMFHDSIATISYVMVALGFVSLGIAVTFHVLRHQIHTVFLNLRDFVGLFVPTGKPKTVKGVRVLVFNWRDKKHMWAGGAEEYIHEISKKWVTEGNQVTLFCGNDRRNPRNETVDGITIIRRGGFYTVYIWAILYYVFKFRRNYDIILDSENGIPFFSPLFSTKPVVLLIHHVHQEIFIEHMKFPFSYIGKFIEGKVMPLVYKNKTLITVSESSKEEIVKFGFAKENSIHIVNPGINETEVSANKTAFPSFIYLGRLKPYKNIDIAIKAFHAVSAQLPKAQFFIVGEGEQGDELKALVTKLNLQNKVTFFGKVDLSKKNELLAKSWIALQPSQMEGWGITVIEANSCGTPVIASNTKGLRDSIVNGKTGILVKVKDISGFAAEMLILATNRKKLTEMSRNAFLWSKNFSWSASSDNLFAVLATELTSKRVLLSPQRIGYLINRVTSLF